MHLLLYCVTAILNTNIRMCNLYSEPLKSHNLYYIAHRHTLLLPEHERSVQNSTVLFYFLEVKKYLTLPPPK